MRNYGRLSAFVGLASLISVGFVTSASAEDDFCRWGGDNGQSLRCFDCMRLVRAETEWRWVNTCRHPSYVIFEGFRRY